jgi:hypothetical protein
MAGNSSAKCLSLAPSSISSAPMSTSEVDGGQHAVRAAADAQRTEVLTAAGYFVLRFWNNDVLENIDGVLEEIAATLRPEPPHPNPLRHGERGRR